jgi:hypothetical protein
MDKNQVINESIQKLKDESSCNSLDHIVIFLINEKRLDVKDYPSIKLKKCVIEHMKNILNKQIQSTGAVKDMHYFHRVLDRFNNELNKQEGNALLTKPKSRTRGWLWGGKKSRKNSKKIRKTQKRKNRVR